MIKKILYTLILIMFLASVYIHGNAKDIPLQDVKALLLEEKTISSMEESSDREMLEFMNIDPAALSEYIYFQGTEALSVEELMIIKVKDTAELAALKDAVEQRIEDQISTFESYGPVQVAMLENAIISTKGHYLFYSVGKYSEKYKEVFFHAI